MPPLFVRTRRVHFNAHVVKALLAQARRVIVKISMNVQPITAVVALLRLLHVMIRPHQPPTVGQRSLLVTHAHLVTPVTVKLVLPIIVVLTMDMAIHRLLRPVHPATLIRHPY
jgi:hypothetical protein